MHERYVSLPVPCGKPTRNGGGQAGMGGCAAMDMKVALFSGDAMREWMQH